MNTLSATLEATGSTKECIHCLAKLPSTYPLYCPACGEKIEPIPLRTKEMLRSWWRKRVHDASVFALTSRDLLLNPGKVVRSYWEGPRGKYYQPINYYVFITSIIAFVTLTFSPQIEVEELIRRNNEMMGVDYIQPEIGDNEQAAEIQQSTVRKQAEFMLWVRKHFNLMMMATIPFFVLAVFLSVRKLGYTYGQQFIFGVYISGFASLIGMPMFFFRDPLNSFDPTALISLGIGIAYYAWSFRSLYQFSWIKSIWKGIQVIILLLAFIIGFSIVVGIVAVIIGFIVGRMGLLS